MALKLSNNCHVCQYIIQHPEFVQRLYRSRAYGATGYMSESLSLIARETELSRQSLHNHCKQHQTMDSSDLEKTTAQALAKAEVNSQLSKTLSTREKRGKVIDRLYDMVEEGKFDDKAKLTDLLTALKHADDIAAKDKDQDRDWMKMMQGIRSGEVEVIEGVIEGEVVE